MRVQAKAIRSKPQVSLNVAVGELVLTADDLADAAILTAIYRVFFGANALPLQEAVSRAAYDIANEMKQHDPEFVMQLPRKRMK